MAKKRMQRKKTTHAADLERERELDAKQEAKRRKKFQKQQELQDSQAGSVMDVEGDLSEHKKTSKLLKISRKSIRKARRKPNKIMQRQLKKRDKRLAMAVN
eukprot:CAMPEP_0119304434 /NCGR_PEP_ID=MMETSP1333-20130426/5652_1 /TAXON_ID=418940 /ORGANISM="Scyphosphaera apsteinii, Strain RCC1455" /LENGTH=100 /DNA_ID=CAMNT_0007307315 /DNA_START=18 /DNA_END=320 /DNA_ORIENTATION=+